MHKNLEETRSLTYSHKGDLLVVGGEKGSIWVYDTSTWKIIRKFGIKEVNGGVDIDRLIFSSDDQLIAAVSQSQSAEDKGKERIDIWSREGKNKGTIFIPEEFTYALDFSPDGNILAVGVSHRNIRIFDMNTFSEIRIIDAEDVRGVSFSPDGKRMVSVGYHGRVLIWDTKSWKKIDQYSGHLRYTYVWGASFTTDGKILATCSSSQQSGAYRGGSGAIWLWDVSLESKQNE